MREECLALVNAGLTDERVSIKILSSSNIGNMLKFPANIIAEEKRDEYEETAAANFNIIQKNLVSCAMDIESGEIQRAALTSIKILIKNYLIIESFV